MMPGTMDGSVQIKAEARVKLEGRDDGYRPRPQLAEPGHYMRDVRYLINAMNRQEIDVNPEYQREVVWTVDRMSGLIDSLMENYYVPPIILNRKMPPRGVIRKPLLVCVDGKQRLSSIRAFVQGLISCTDHLGDKWWYCAKESGSARQKILPPDMKEHFLNKEFVTFEYSGLAPEQEEDLFARVQMGMQLTAAEKLRAQSGPWQELAKCFINDFSDIYSLLKDRSRQKDFQLTLSCFCQIVEVLNPTSSDGVPVHKGATNQLPKFLRSTVNDDLRSQLANSWKTLQDLLKLEPNVFKNENRWLQGVQTFAPVEMIACTVLILKLSDHDNQALLGHIKAIRGALRENFSDLRMNIQTWRFIWKFISNIEATSRESNGPSAGSQSLPKIKRESIDEGPLVGPAASDARPCKKQRKESPTIPQRPAQLSGATSSHSVSLDDLPDAVSNTTLPVHKVKSPVMPAETCQTPNAEQHGFRAPVAPMSVLPLRQQHTVPPISIPSRAADQHKSIPLPVNATTTPSSTTASVVSPLTTTYRPWRSRTSSLQPNSPKQIPGPSPVLASGLLQMPVMTPHDLNHSPTTQNTGSVPASPLSSTTSDLRHRIQSVVRDPLPNVAPAKASAAGPSRGTPQIWPMPQLDGANDDPMSQLRTTQYDIIERQRLEILASFK